MEYIVKHDHITGKNGIMLHKGQSYNETAFVSAVSVQDLLKAEAIEAANDEKAKKTSKVNGERTDS